jgi:hypothetical protein
VDQHVNVLRLVFPELAPTSLVRAKKAVGPRTPQENKILVSVLRRKQLWSAGVLRNPLLQHSITPVETCQLSATVER